MGYWGNDSYWRSLSGPERAAAMALLEADSHGGQIDMEAAKKRSERWSITHVSQRIYQPTIQDAQYQRLGRIIGSPEHKQLTELAQRRLWGEAGDWVNGATHFLAHERTMLGLEAQDRESIAPGTRGDGAGPSIPS